MFSTLFAVSAVLPVVVLALGPVVPDDNQMIQGEGFVRYPVASQQGGPIFGRHSKRQQEVGSFGKQSGTLYTIDLILGTPGQAVPVQFDTGSSELWVNPVCSKSTTPAFCSAQPRFTTSTTLVDLGVTGQVTYGTGYADFEYVYDYVGIGSAKIKQQIFGVAYDSAHAVVGIMGAGPELSGWDSSYPLIVDSLAEQGFTNSRAFSMDLRGFDSARGSVIFGGLDTKKYSGNLEKLPIIPAAESPDGYTRFWVYLNGISVNQPDGTIVGVYKTPVGGKGQPVLLDSGYTLSALPNPIFSALVAAFPSAQYVPGSDVYTFDCLDPGQGGSVDFTFGGTVISVPYYDFVWHLPDSTFCILGAFEDEEFPVLGDTFLRAAYVIYDWDNRNIHVAQSLDCGANVVAIGKGVNAVPSFVGECGSVTPTSSSSSSIPVSTSTSSSSVSSSTPESTSTSTSSVLSSSSSIVSSSSSSIPVLTSTSSSSVSSSSSYPGSTSTSSSSDVSSASSSSPGSTSTSSSTTSSSYSSTTSSSSPSSSASSSLTPSHALTSSLSSSIPPSPYSATSTSQSTSLPVTKSSTSTVSYPVSSRSAATSSTVSSSGITSVSDSKTTITFTTTSRYTVTSCPPEKTLCHVGAVTTKVVTAVTTVCPETTGHYTIHKTTTCSGDSDDCPAGATKTAAVTVTVTPVKTLVTPTVVPGCTTGANGPTSYASYNHGVTSSVRIATTMATTAAPCATCGKASNATASATATGKVFVAGAAQLRFAPALTFLAIGGLWVMMGL